MDAELIGDLANADQAVRLLFRRGHAPNLQQQSVDCLPQFVR
jgi:hypothetical protein